MGEDKTEQATSRAHRYLSGIEFDIMYHRVLARVAREDGDEADAQAHEREAERLELEARA